MIINSIEIPTTQIPNFSRYTIDRDARIFDTKRKIFLKSYYINNKYEYVNLYDAENVKTTITRPRLLELTFSPNNLTIPTIQIPNFSRYLIDINGNIYSKIRKRFLKPRLDKDTYKIVTLKSDDKKTKIMKVHRLVGLTFIPNPDNKPFIDHIDRNKSNNSITNLRWATRLENCANRSNTKYNKTGYKNIGISKDGYLIIAIMRNHKFLFRKQYSIKKYSLDEVVVIRNEIYKEFNIEIMDK